MGDNLIILTREEWDEINASLPDVSSLCNRIRLWPFMEFLIDFNHNRLHQKRLSQVCFRDSANYLYNARYALGQAIGMRRHYLSRSQKERDENHVLADVRSRFFADYVPLLLYSSGEHARIGVLELLELKAEVHKYKGGYALEKTRKMLDALKPNTAFTKAIQQFDDSEARKHTWGYRNDWVHNAPQRVETVIYNPPRQSFVEPPNKDMPYSTAWMGVETPFDFTWADFITLLQEGISATADFLTACADEWEKFHDR